jgi:hypothetical protein
MNGMGFLCLLFFVGWKAELRTSLGSLNAIGLVPYDSEVMSESPKPKQKGWNTKGLRPYWSKIRLLRISINHRNGGL